MQNIFVQSYLLIAERKLEHLQAVTKEMSDKLSSGMHSSPWQQLTEDDKQHLYSHLKDKLNTVSEQSSTVTYESDFVKISKRMQVWHCVCVTGGETAG